MAKKYAGENTIQEVISKTKTLVANKQNLIDANNKLSADLIQDGSTNKTVTATEKSTWNGKADASALSSYLPLAGGTMTGLLQINAPLLAYPFAIANDLKIGNAAHNYSTRFLNDEQIKVLGERLRIIFGNKSTTNEKASFCMMADNNGTLTEEACLGDASYRWSNLYLKNNISDGTNTVSVANLNNYMKYTTTAPAGANTDGLKIALLDSEPATKYAGWIYLIKES